MVVNTIFDVAEFQRKKKAALAKSGKTKLSAAETAQLKKSADKALNKYKNLTVVELTKGGKSTGRYFLRGELKGKQGGTRWRILSKKDADTLAKTHGTVSQAVKAKPPKKARGKKSPATRKKSTGKKSPAARKKSTGKKSPATKKKSTGKKSPATKKKSTGKKSPATRKKSTGKKSPKQNLLRRLKKAELLKVARHYNMRAPEKLSVGELRERIGNNKTEKQIRAAL